MWNTSVSLVTKETVSVDAEGYETVSVALLKGIPANRRDTTRTDIEIGNQSGYSADVTFEINSANYNGEAVLIDDSNKVEYDINRTFRRDKSNTIILTCTRREHGKNRT